MHTLRLVVHTALLVEKNSLGYARQDITLEKIIQLTTLPDTKWEIDGCIISKISLYSTTGEIKITLTIFNDPENDEEHDWSYIDDEPANRYVLGEVKKLLKDGYQLTPESVKVFKKAKQYAIEHIDHE